MKTKLMALEALKSIDEAFCANDNETREGRVAARKALTSVRSAIAALEADIAQPVEPVMRHIHEHAAELLIDHFLCAKLGVNDAPSVRTEKQGERDTESHSWAFWILDNDTTSYLHEDGRIEWLGTGWYPEVAATPGAAS